ncbi:Uu.00g074280.m01.CDS01 [Anthostomella pinea]|uniref:Uu.00g074280.m01.CDS01 n=1 Tax=Anthostomella pinea TaxID=933095 RepID=A0AAI8VWM9_9PEZI|nr:Uu.00g074280.m01.CDS01 [Anthostomella pinea]
MPGSREFNLRLVEMVVVSVHQIGVLLFQEGDKMHQGDIDSVMSWVREPEKDDGYLGIHFVPKHFPAHPTLFVHYEYLDFDQYPAGLADVAGYWAEDLVIEGVVLFDRAGNTTLENQHVYVHSGRDWKELEQTVRVWRLSETQLDDFIKYLSTDSPQET